jgi:hypothetical protein
MSNSQVSQIIGKTPTKNIGNSIAPRIEAAYGVSSGWLDIPQPDDQVGLDESLARPTEETKFATTLTRVTPEELALLEKYRMSDEVGRMLIETVSDQTKKLSIDDVMRNQLQSGS